MVSRKIKLDLTFLFSFIVLYPIGYFLIVISSRYLWFEYLFTGLLTFYFIDVLSIKWRLSYLKQYLIVSIILVTTPLKQFFFFKNQGKSMFSLTKKINSKIDIPPYSKIASFDEWHKYLKLSYLLNLQYFG